jgi:hypothetical protein
MAGDAPDPDHSTVEEYREHAVSRARENGVGLGAAVVSSSFENGQRVWTCIVTDEAEWHYTRVLGPELGPFPDLSSDDVEEGIERFAATLPAEGRIRYVVNANPMHIEPDGSAHD